ncbi:TetR/AcrR family transcriptional regulator [Dactylosporangium darangshiense]|uniref:TetR/AcrR family transcriptional regulator n=1 Tax=Dactylosporangium darangshiense TaxID=579108 RepID=A0ABP8D6N9_9ACTN
MPATPAPRRTGGRTRSESARADALRAAAEILEADGYAAVTIEGVASRSQVAKSTIYRWWNSKADLVMEAYQHLITERMPEPDTGTLAGDLEAFVAELYRVTHYPARMKALRGLMAEAQLDAAFAALFRAWVQTRRETVAALLHRAIDRGEIPATTDVDYAVDSVFGPFWYRLLVGHLPLDPADASAHVGQLMHGLRRATGR